MAPQRSWRAHLPAVALHGLLTGVVLWPAVRHFSTQPMIGTGDSSIFYWSWWNLGRSVQEGRSPLHTDALFHPVGADLSVTVSAPAIGVLSWPVRALFGPEAQVNAVQLSAGFLAALLMYFLLLRVGSGRLVAAVVGGAFACTPFRFVHLTEHLNLVHTGVLPAVLLLALRLADRPSAGRWAALGAGVGLSVLVEPQLAVISGIGAVVVVARKWEGPRPDLAHLGVGLGVAIAAAAPVAIPLAIAVLAGESSATPGASALPAFSARVTSWFVPPPTHPWFGGISDVDPLSSPLEGVAAPGLVLLGLALLGRRLVSSADRRGWVAMTWIAAVLALGPYVALGDEWVGIPLPYRLLHEIPLLHLLRVPGRFVVLGVAGVCVLAAQAATAALARWPERRPLFAVAWLVLAVELVPGSLPGRAGGAPDAYDAIADDRGSGAVLEIPLQWSTGVDLVGYPQLNVSLFQAWATVHERPYVGGTVSRYSEERQTELESIPLYRQVRALQGDEGMDGPVDFKVADLAELGIGYVVYHRNVPIPEARAYFEALDLPVLADDGVVLVWRVPRG